MILLILLDISFSIRFLVLHYNKVNPTRTFREGPRYPEPVANLILRTTAGNNLPDYGLMVVKNLRSMEIDVEMKVEERGTFNAQLNNSYDYDLFLISLNTSEITEQLFWTVGNYDNPTGLNITIPYVSLATDLLNNSTKETDMVEKRGILLEWQYLVMDKIVCLLPLVNTGFENYNQTVYLGFNLQRPFIGGVDNYEYLNKPDMEVYTKSSAIRKAICYAIDRDVMNREINDGEGEIIHSIFIPYHSYWINTDVPNYYRNADIAYVWFYAAGYFVSMSGSYRGKYLFFAVLILLLNIIPVSVLVFLSYKWKKYHDDTLLEEKQI